ncbi:uncharacterized protein HD556DRAFT_1222861, partial [Suillus plorans]
DEIIELHRAALLRPPGHPDRSMSFNNLSAGLRDRPPQQYVPSDIDELGGTALLLRPLGHPDRCLSTILPSTFKLDFFSDAGRLG